MTMIKSETTNKIYDPNKTIRIVNIKQILFYMSRDVEILDFYPSEDFKTKEPVLVFIVSKYDSYEAYQDWMKSREQ